MLCFRKGKQICTLFLMGTAALYSRVLQHCTVGYCSTVQGLLDWFEVDLGFTELSFIQIDLCVLVRETDMHTDPPKKTYARVEKTSVHKQRNMQCQGEKYMHKNQKK